MKKIFAVAPLFLFVQILVSQKYDYRWILGHASADIDIIFTPSTADTIRTQRGADLQLSSVTISDSSGDLQFFSDGAKIYSWSDSTMRNGDSINYGPQWDNVGGTGYLAVQDLMALPTDKPNIWNLLHYYEDINFTTLPVLYPWRIYQTRIDMNGDSGRGKVLFKNKTLIQDTLGGYVIACKHANGRDWWVITSKTSSTCLYELLVQPDTIINYGMQCLGGYYISGDAGQSAFTPDGTKFAWVGGPGGVNLFDFDRCTGVFTNPQLFPLYRSLDSSLSQYGLSFSPSSRFMYVNQSRYIFQLDLQSTNIWSSLDTVGRYQPPPDTPSFAGPYFLMQLAPDGKIYISAESSIRWLHVINEPDKKGDSCNFVNYGFPLPYNNAFGLPSYPNYRLGALVGSPCDTLTTLTTLVREDKEKTIKVFPNAATNYAIIDYGFTDWNKGEVTLEISNELGQRVYIQKLPMYSGFQKIDVSQFAAGLYTVAIIRNNGVVAVAKFVKQ